MYAVVVYHSFEMDMPIYLFNNEEKAQKYLHKLYEEALAEEISENSELNMESTYYDSYSDFARIEWADGCYTEYTVTYVTQMD